jgi:hypothetical protein
MMLKSALKQRRTSSIRKPLTLPDFLQWMRKSKG